VDFLLGQGLVCVSVLDLSAHECYVLEGSLLLSDVMNRSRSLITTFFVAVELWTKSGSSERQGGYHITQSDALRGRISVVFVFPAGHTAIRQAPHRDGSNGTQ